MSRRWSRLACFASGDEAAGAWLQLEVEGDGAGSIIRQTAIFDAVGLLGLLYWYALYPLYSCVFRGMLRGIVRELEKQEKSRAL